MPKKKTKSSTTKKISKPKTALISPTPTKKYFYLLALLFVGLLGYFGYKQLAQPTDINLVYSGGAPAVVIRGNDVWVKGDAMATKDTEGAKWVPPGTYAGMPCASGQTTPCQLGRTISGHFFPWGTYGTFVPPTAAEQQAASNFTSAVYQAAGYTTKNPCGGDFYYYSTVSNTCKQLKEVRPSMYSPRMTCKRVQNRCSDELKSTTGSDSHRPNGNQRSKYVEPIEANTAMCFTTLANCEQAN